MPEPYSVKRTEYLWTVIGPNGWKSPKGFSREEDAHRFADALCLQLTRSGRQRRTKFPLAASSAFSRTGGRVDE